MLTKLKELLLKTFEIVRKGNREINSNTMKDFYRKEKGKNDGANVGHNDNPDDKDASNGGMSGIKNEVED